MLPNKILSNHTVSEQKREAVANQSNQNSSDRKFEDAMYESRQHQLNTEQRQEAAKNDHVRQQQRQQQEQTQARVENERNAQRAKQSNNAKTEEANNQSNKRMNPRSETQHSQDRNQGADKVEVTKDATNDVDDSKPTDKSETEIAADANVAAQGAVHTNKVDESNIDPQSKNATTDDNTKSDMDVSNEVDSASWLDTFMKIVADNEKKSDQSSSSQTTDNDKYSKSVAASDGQTRELPSDELIDMLLESEQSAVKKLFSDFASLTSQQQDDSEIQFSQLTSLLADKVAQEGENNDAENVTDDGETKSADQDQIISDLLAQTQKNVSQNTDSNLDGKDSSLNAEAQSEKKLNQDNAQVIANSALQQQIQQAQNADNTKQPSLVEQTTKQSNVLSFVNPALMQINKQQNATEIENGKFSAQFSDELDELMNTEVKVSNKNEMSTDAELKSILDIRTASLFANQIDSGSKGTDSFTKPELVDVNGVQLDKTLQLPKLEQLSQAKNETLLRENILFNKQELANHMQQQVGLMMSKNMKSIDIRLDPPELGAMQIKLTMNNDQAAVSFVVSNQQAKDALDASLPRLRELLEQQGMNLAESDVQHGSAQGESTTGDDNNGANSGNGMSNDDAQDDANLHAQEQLNRAIKSPWNVDYYA
ncbi:flagellar hook-length control protein FliK [Psychrosphaera sp. F3M07]|uniref:flagellar hook-length control protein FliK n=1 Tax=Psychrosphaera sp. F3M07 TaxID=2841560 RepID=UPI001C0A0AE4|nr:flagellar hook-length control protein FliK [Psychrosphaera sp. F3M07]MBU2917500.1 flagellar hook-length control protein FliK [Psychrosphaera sp. F3M07]